MKGRRSGQGTGGRLAMKGRHEVTILLEVAIQRPRHWGESCSDSSSTVGTAEFRWAEEVRLSITSHVETRVSNSHVKIV